MSNRNCSKKSRLEIGASLVEYTVLTALISLVALISIERLGKEVWVDNFVSGVMVKSPNTNIPPLRDLAYMCYDNWHYMCDDVVDG